MKLLIQPEDGIKPLVEGLRKAKKSIHILIFRFDRPEIEAALVEAVQRGVMVEALIAYTNQGEEKNLRRLEMRLLGHGVTVARTADDLVRYHGKMFVVDERTLYLLGFNFTHMDIDISRSFGLVITKKALVAEALRLFECDARRKPYKKVKSDLVVSPVNARQRLTEFIAGAKKRLLIYEMKISDGDFLKLLNRKITEGVEVRILSRASAKGGVIPVRRLPTRLHLRAILRDGSEAFLGSQSLRTLELEARREIGAIVHDKHVVKEMEEIFDADWKRSEAVIEPSAVDASLAMPAKKVAKELAKQIALKPMVEKVLDRVMDENENAQFEPEEVAQTVQEAFREEVKGAVVHALKEVVLQTADERTKEPAA